MNLKMHIYGLYDYIRSFVMVLIKLVVLFHALQRVFKEIRNYMHSGAAIAKQNEALSLYRAIFICNTNKLIL